MRQKTCPYCRQKYQPERPLQVACSIPCVIQHVNTLKAKRERKDLKEAKAKLKTRADWMREAQAAFNAWIRKRDENLPCISCGRNHQGQFHAGHFRTTKAAPELRFSELNVHKQCSVCNNYLSGNIIEYRRNLLVKIGADNVDWLEGPHEPKKYTVEDLKAIRDEYRRKFKEME